MKIAISFPPITNSLGQKAMVAQNRNVQYFSVPTYLLGITYAQAATSLKKKVMMCIGMMAIHNSRTTKPGLII